MDIVEQAKIRLVIDGKEAVNELSVVGARMDALKEKIKGLEKGTKEHADAVKALREESKTYKLIEERMDVSKMSMKQLTSYQRDLNRAIKDMDPASEAFKKTSDKLKEAAGRSAELNAMVKGTNSTAAASESIWTKLGGWIKGAFMLTGVIALVGWIIDLGRSIFDVTSKFEKYKTVLTTALGSQEAANAAFAMLQKIASTTPFSVDEMTASSIKLVNRGILPTTKELKQMADIAASQGKSFDQLTEAILDAQMGESERLKEFGIRMRTNNDEVTLSFKGQTVEVKNNEKAIYDAIVAMGTYEGVAGSTSSMMETLSGKTSNLGDMWDMVVFSIGDKLKPVFVWLLDAIMKGILFVGQWVDNIGIFTPVLDMWRKYIGFVGDQIKTVFLYLFPEASKSTITLGGFMKGLAVILNIIPASLMAIATAIKAVMGFFGLLGQGAVVISKFFSGDFKGASQAAEDMGKSYEKLKNTVVVNFKAIGNSFTDIVKTQEKGMSSIDDLWDKHILEQLKGQKKVTEDAGKNAKEREAAAKKMAAEIVKAEKAMLKEIEKANELADKTIRKGLEDNMRAKVASNKAELDASEKLRKELMDNALKMALFKDSVEKLERIKKAKSLEEIEKIESEYKDKALKRELDYSKIFLERKEKEFTDLKKLGALTKEEEDKRAKELLVLRQDVADKELDITKKGISDKQKQLKDDKDYVDGLWKQEVEDFEKKEKEKADLKVELIKQVGDEAKRLTNEFLQNAIAYYQKEVDAADGAMKKFFAQQKLNSAKNTASVISGAVDVASGDYVQGSIKIVTGIVKFFDQEFNAYAKALEARAAATAERIKRNLDTLLPRLQATISGLEDIESVYKKVGEDPFKGVTDSLTKLNEIYAKLLANHLSGIDKMTERANNSALALVDAEIAIGEQIISNWELATDKQNKLFEEKKSLIQKTYDDEISKINQKYDYESIKLNQRFDAESLAITEGVNNDLMAFVTNQDLKLGLTSEYEKRRSEIAEKFALSYVPITEGMTQTEIDGINASIKARDEAFAKLADWQTVQIQFVIDNGKLERDTFTETQKVISDGKEAQYQLSLDYKSKEIENEIARNAEKDAAEAVRKASLTLEEENYTNAITALNLAKDEAIAASMERLKNFMITAIGDMQNRYAEMVAKGIEGSEAMLESLNKLKDAYYELYNAPLPGANDSRGSNTPSPTDNPAPTNTPRFEKGSIYVDPYNLFPDGTDTVPARLNKGERVLDKDLNALLGGISNQELVRRAIGGVSASNAGLVNKISSSTLATFGSPLAPKGGMMTASLRQAQADSFAQPTASYHSNFETGRMEELLADIHRAIVDKPVLDMGTLGAANDAVAVNVGKSRFA